MLFVVVRFLTEELCSAVAQHEAGDPDAPSWEAEVRAHRARLLIDALLDQGAAPATEPSD